MPESDDDALPDFSLTVSVGWSREDEVYVASSETAPFTLVMGHGDTREDALRQFARALHAVLADGQRLPPY